MTQKTYCDELMRALARPDAVALRRTIDLLHAFIEAQGEAREDFWIDQRGVLMLSNSLPTTQIEGWRWSR